ncbi:MAG: 2-isopropylmalate synthase [Elusimicrobia bacterium]|nr:MAG: 2-isopropylmalate synthase [Elusimicrobiota bacterium]
MSGPEHNPEIIHDWNRHDPRAAVIPSGFSLFDETLRDGIQSRSVHDPDIEDKIRIVELLDAVGVEYLDVSLPGSGPRAVEDTVRIIRAISDRKLRIRPACAARTHLNDIRPIVEISQRTGTAIEVMTFIGSSPIRVFAEDWDAERMLKLSAEAIDFCVQNNLPACYVTEDTTRAHPEMLASLFKTAMDHGAYRLCLCDTVGHATPDGVRALLGFTADLVKQHGGQGRIKLDWHGHNDRGLAVINALVALTAGADRVHGTVLGVGERVGNAALDQILVNLYLLGVLPGSRELSKLVELASVVSRACQVPIPYNYPVLGGDAFRTATGVHAAAIIKAERKGDAFLADRIYSSVPAGLFGRQQEIEVGPMSGESNVHYWLRRRGIQVEPQVAKKILAYAKTQVRLLTSDEIMALVSAG